MFRKNTLTSGRRKGKNRNNKKALRKETHLVRNEDSTLRNHHKLVGNHSATSTTPKKEKDKRKLESKRVKMRIVEKSQGGRVYID